MQQKQQPAIRLVQKAICLALVTAFPAVEAQEDDEVLRLIRPESSVSIGVGHVSGDNQRFGVYNGLNREGTVGLMDFSVIRREDETGTWLRLQGRNLGLSTRELSAEYERQGDYRATIDFSQIPRVSPYDIQTDLGGLGTANQSYPTYTAGTTRGASTNTPLTLKTERQVTKLGFSKSLSPTLEFKVNFQNDEKNGNRMFGRGLPGAPGAMEFLAEPINSTIRQLDAVLDYTGERLQLSGGYYGSFYDNRNGSLSIAGGSNGLNENAASAANRLTVIALPPDNHAHQLHLTGAYDFTRTTRGSFKVGHTTARQVDDFVQSPGGTAFGNNISGRNDLGGRVDTTLAQAKITSRPITGLSLLASARYEDRDDNTAVVQYINGLGPTSTTTGLNEPRSLRTTSGKLEASYLLPKGFRVTGSADHELMERSMSGVRVVGYRSRTEETSYRVELQRAMAETLTGSLAYVHSERTGSDYRNLSTLGNLAYPTFSQGAPTCATPSPGQLNGMYISRCGLLQPVYIADRDRNKVRLALDWSPIDSLSTQFVFEDSRDDYGQGRGNPDIGVRKGDAHLYSVDLTYTLTDNWKLTSWAARSDNSIDQATIANVATNAPLLWSAQLKNEVDSYAVGARGKLYSARVDVGADYIFAHDKTAYRMAKEAGTGTVSSLPDITWKQTTLKLFGRYAYTKDVALRLDYIFDHRRTNDWTWNGWRYTDGTQVAQRLSDTVHFIGLSMNYAFR